MIACLKHLGPVHIHHRAASTKMFGSIGSYLYDRRRGLLKSAGVIGTLYLAGKYAIQRLEEIKEAVLTERNAKEK